MTQIQAIDLREKQRVDLGKEAPLPAPLAMYIEPSSLCNLRCAFCPTGDDALRQRRPNGLMSMEVWHKIINDLVDWGVRLHRVNLYKDGEPLVNKHFVEMVRVMKRAGVTREIWTKTNGIMLKPDLNTLLASSGLDMLGISINGVNAEQYKRITGMDIDYPRLIRNVTDLFYRRGALKVYVKIADFGLSAADKQKFMDDFCPISDNCAIESLHGWSDSATKDWTLGTNPTTFEGYPLVEKIACPLPFYMLAVNWNGTVSPCNEDWQHAAILGDVRRESLKQIWQGERMREFMLMHLQGRRGENKSCANCNYLTTLPDNLDHYRKYIVRRINEKNNNR